MKIKLVPKEAEDDPEIKPGSRYCDEHPDDPRCKEHKKAIHGEQATQPEDCPDDEHWDPDQQKCVPNAEEQVAEEPEDCPEGEVWDPRAGKCVTATTQEAADLDTPRTSTSRVSPTIQQGQYPDLGTISHTDPITAVGTSPGIITAHPKEKQEPDMVTHDTEPADDPRHRPIPQVEIPEPTSKDTKVEPVHPGATDAGKSYATPGAPETLPTPTPVPEAPLDQAGAELGDAQEPHTCADGYHWSFDHNGCVPDEPITEMVKRIKAEAKLVHNEQGMKAYEQHYIDALTMERKEGNRIRNHAQVLERHNTKLTRLYDHAVRDLRNEQIKAEQWMHKRDEAAGKRDDWKRAYEELRLKHEDVTAKYHQSMKTNLELSQRMTRDNEDYLELHRKFEGCEEARKRMRNEAKKIIKVKAT